MTWEMTDHACSRCFGRVLEQEDATKAGAGRWLYRCAECGLEGLGTALAVCCCSTQIGGRAGLECVRNPSPTRELPQEVLVRQRREERKERDRQVPARVEIGADRGFLG